MRWPEGQLIVICAGVAIDDDRSEGAIPGTRLVDPPHRVSRDDRRDIDDGVDRAFVADEVDVTAVVDEA